MDKEERTISLIINEADNLMNAVRKNQTPGAIGNLYTLPSSYIQVSLSWTVEEGKKLDLDSSCMVVDSNGDVLMDESVYFGNLVNSNGSIRHSGDVINGGKDETIFCDLDSVPPCVHELYFLLTVDTKEKTLKDANSALVKVVDTTAGKLLCQYTPKLAGDSPSVLFMRITRASENWRVSLVNCMCKTAKEFGNLIPEALKQHTTHNLVPSTIVNPKPGSQGSRLDSKNAINEPKDNTNGGQSLENLNGTVAEKSHHDLELGKFSHRDNEIETMRLQITSMEEKLNEMKSLVSTSDDMTNDTIEQKESVYTLENDIYNLIMLSEPISITWFFSLLVIFFQMILVITIMINQLNDTLAIPFTVSTSVTIGQFFALLISIVTQTDMFDSIKTSVVICNQEEADWKRMFKVPEHMHLRNRQKYLRAVIPNFFKFCCGALVLSSSFIIIIGSDDVIDLFTNFAALQIISLIDNAFFLLGEQGFFGRTIRGEAKQAKNVRVPDAFPSVCRNVLPLQLVITFILLVGMVVGWLYIVIEQENGTIFSTDYPNCDIKTTELVRIGDGKCDGGAFNTVQCGFDGGDCVMFNLAFPECKAENPSLIGDGTCQEKYNIENCGFDGGDCCPYDKSDPLLGDGECHGLWYNTKQCDFDGGDCLGFNRIYQECFVDLKRISTDILPVILGDGNCDGNIYDTEACGYENGDCIGVIQNNPSLLPTARPTKRSSTVPTTSPTTSPTVEPTLLPTGTPTTASSSSPTTSPTVKPTPLPTGAPSVVPTSSPTTGPKESDYYDYYYDYRSTGPAVDRDYGYDVGNF